MAARVGYLTTAQVMEQYGISFSTLYRWRSSGKVKGYKFARDRLAYWKVTELDRMANPTDGPSVRKQREIIS